MKKVRLAVKSMSDKSYRHVVTGTEDGVSEQEAEKITRGLLRNMGDDFFVDEEAVK